jgi:sugar lactone lactonase YvrE
VTEVPPSGDSATASEVLPPPDLGIPGLVDHAVVGRGGSGVVYRANQPTLNRVVAVKVLSAYLDAPGRERFEREGFAMGTVAGHPHIITVLSTGTTRDGRPYLLMPFLGGGSLAERLPLSWPEAVSHVIKLCGALETAHRAGVLHRDVKPANVLVSAFEEPVLADFGISRVSGGYETSEGLVNASLPFAAPEILGGGPASIAADVYSLAATLFCAIAGEPPFAARRGELVVATYLRISGDPVPDLRPAGVPSALCVILESALAKDPEQRPRSAAEFGRRLQDVQRVTGQPVTAMTLTTDPAAEAGRAADAVTVGVPVEVITTTPLPPPVPPGKTPAELVTPLARTATVRHPDLTRIEPAPAVRPVRSGRRRAGWLLAAVLLVAVAAAAVFLWPMGTTSSPGAGTQLAGLSDPRAIAAAPDGTVYIADSGNHRVQRVSAGGGVDTYVGTGEIGNTGNGRPAAEATIESPSALALAADGTLFLASGGLVRQVDPQGVIGPVSGFDPATGVIALTLQSDGSLYAADRTELLVRRPDGSVESLAGANGEFGHIEGIAVDPDGSIVVTDSGRDQILRVDPQGSVTTLAGLGSAGSDPDGDGYPAEQTALSGPAGIAFDTDGRLHVSEGGMNRVREIQQDGTLLTVAGNPEGYSEGYAGDGGPATQAVFNLLTGPLAFDGAGSLYILDVNNDRVRRVAPDGTVQTIA